MDAINASIIEQLTAIAREYFPKLNAAAGAYSAQQCAKLNTWFISYQSQRRALKETISETVKINCRTIADVHAKARAEKQIEDAKQQLAILEAEAADKYSTFTVTAGTYTLTALTPLVFQFLDAFESMERVPNKNRAKFIAEGAAGGACLEVVIPKEAAALANLTEKPSARCHTPREYIYINAGRSELLATNTLILAAYPVEISGDVSDLTKAPICISPKHIKQLAGKCTIYYDAETKTTTAINEAGEVFVTTPELCGYVDYSRAFPATSPGRYLQFTAAAVEGVLKFAKAAAKFAAKADNGNAPFEMQCKPGDTSVMFTAAAAAGEQSSYTAELAAPAGVDLLCRFSSKLFTAAATGWNGGMWFSRANGPAILDCAGAVCTLIMPMIVEGARMDCAEEAVIPALERFNHLPEGVALPAQKKATRRKKTASTAAPANSVEAAPAPAPTVTPEEVTAATDTYAESYAAWLTGDAQSDITPEESEAAITAQYKALSALIEQYHIERKEAPENAAIEARRYITKLHEDVAAADRARRARITEQCNRARAFVDWFVGAVDTVAGVMLRAALNAAVERVKELAALAGVPLVDVLADAVPVPPPTPEHSDGGESQPEAEAVEVSEAESAAAPVEADLQPSEVAACAVGVPPSEAAAPIAATMEAYGAPAVAGGRYATIAATGGNTTPRAGKLARKHTHRIRDGTTVEASQSSPLNYNPSFIM